MSSRLTTQMRKYSPPRPVKTAPATWPATGGFRHDQPAWLRDCLFSKRQKVFIREFLETLGGAGIQDLPPSAEGKHDGRLLGKRPFGASSALRRWRRGQPSPCHFLSQQSPRSVGELRRALLRQQQELFV